MLHYNLHTLLPPIPVDVRIISDAKRNIHPLLVGQLALLEPFGVGNAKPVFAQKEVHILNGRILGKNRNVGKYYVTDA